MVIERGGLVYPIKVEDQFSANLQKFRAEIDAAKRSFTDFKTKLSSLAAQSQKLASNQNKIAFSLNRSRAALRNYNRDLKTSASIQSQLNRLGTVRNTRLKQEAAAIQKITASITQKNQQDLDQARVQRILTTTQQNLIAITKQLSATARQRVRENRAESASIRQKVHLLEREVQLKRVLGQLGIARTAAVTGGVTAPQTQNINRARRAQRQFNTELNNTQGAANRIAFTFRRLFGILAAFTAARLLVGGFRDLIVQGLKFNGVLQDTELGIASLLVAVGDVRDATGATVSEANKLALAQKEARRQTGLLRKDALTTAATFEQLLEAFQVALAPGFTAGLAIDEIRRFTVQISQAAAAIGLPQNQLAEEIRSLLTGTIQARTTRIAVSLGISNEDIKRAKELGVLFEFLQERFNAFTVAGEKALKNFNILLTNVQDGIIQIIAEGFRGEGTGVPGLFEEISNLLIGIDDSLKSIKDNEITLNPNLVSIVRAVASGLKEAVIQTKLLVQNISFDQALTIAESLGNILSAAAKTGGVLFESIVNGLSNIGAIVNLISDVFSTINRILPTGLFRELLVFLLSIATTVGLIKISWIALVGAFNLAKIPLKAIQATLGIISTILIGIGFRGAALVANFKKVGAVIAVLAIPLLKVLFLLGAIVGSAFLVETAITKIVKLFTGLDLKITSIVKIGITRLVERLQIAGNFAERLFIKFKRLFTFDQERLHALDAELALLELKNKEIKDLANQKVQQTILSDEKEGRSLKQIVGNATAAIRNGISNLISPITEASGEAKEFGQILRDIPAVISESNREFRIQEEILEEIKNEVLKAKDAFDFASLTIGLEGDVLDQVKASFEAQVKLRDRTEKLTENQKRLEIDLAEIQSNRISTEERFIKLLSTDEKSIVTDLINLAKNDARIRENLTRIQTQLILKRKELEAEVHTEKKKALAEELFELQVQEDASKKLALRLQEQADAAEGLIDPQRLNLVKDIFFDTLVLKEQEIAKTQLLANIDKERLHLAEQLADESIFRVRELALKSTFENRKESIELQGQLSAQLAINQALRNRPRERLDVEAEALARAELETIKLQLDFTKELNDEREEAIQNQILALGSFTGELLPEQIDLQKQLVSQQKRSSLEADILNSRIEELIARLELTEEIAGASFLGQIGIGIREAFVELKDSVKDVFDEIKDIMIDTVTEFSRLVADTLVDALDPTQDVNLLERIGRFLQQVAKQIIEVLVRIALIKAALGLTSLLGSGTGGAVGAAKGGKIKKGEASLAHYANPKGYTRGSKIKRPRGLDPRDTIPIWAQRGEFMMRVAAVKKYGEGVMHKLNQGLIDPLSLEALSGSTKVSNRLHRSKGPGFAAGGQVFPTATRSVVRQSEDNISVAAVVPNEQAFERQLAQGKGSLFTFLQKNKARINAILGK